MSAQFSVGKGGVLLPRNELAHRLVGDRRVGDDVEVVEVDPNDEVLRRKIFWIIGKLAKWKELSIDEMRTELLIELGWSKWIKRFDGRRVMIVNSMSRKAMKSADLNLLWDDIVGYLNANATKLPIALAMELSEYMGQKTVHSPNMPEDEPW